jgi:hypothetical protein
MRVPAEPTAMARTGTAEPGWLSAFIDSRPLLALEIITLAAMTVSVVTRTWQDRMWLGFVLIGVTLLVWSPELFRARFRRWWFMYVAGIFAYTLLRAFADETAVPIQTTYAIQIDRALFFGTDPVLWVQERFFSATQVDPLDYVAVGIHWSFFVVPHALAVAIFLFRRQLFGQYATLIVGTLYLGLLLFFLVPTTPPWLAGVQGDLDGAFRVMDFVGGEVHASTYRRAYASLGEPNSVAAMPSIHMAVTFAMFLWSLEHARPLRFALLAYSAVMGLALVYLAEHYVIDLIAGIVCALVAFFAARRLVAVRKPVAVEHSRPTR